MTIKPPAWAKDAIPTTKGWKHPKRNEILINKKFTQEEIDEYLAGATTPEQPQKVESVIETKPKRTRAKKVIEEVVQETIEEVQPEPETVQEVVQETIEEVQPEPVEETIQKPSFLSKLKR